MENNVKRLIEQHIRETVKIEGRVSVERIEEVHKVQTKALNDLRMEEEVLKTQLENLKNENFSLDISIHAWKATREHKQQELTEADSKLNEVYNEIWSEREEFCTRTDEFNNRFGILSKWWEEKMDEVFNPLRGKEEETDLAKVRELEREIHELQKEIENLEEQKLEEAYEFPQDESLNLNSKGHEESECKNAEEDETTKESLAKCNEDTEKGEAAEMQVSEAPTLEIVKENPKKKKVRFSKESNEVTIYNENADDLKMKFFSIVDMETVRKANRIKSRQKQQFLSKVKKITQ